MLGGGSMRRQPWKEAHTWFLSTLSSEDSAQSTMVQHFCEYTMQRVCSDFSGTLEACMLTLSHGVENSAAAVEQLILAVKGSSPKFPLPTLLPGAQTAVWCARISLSQAAAASELSDPGQTLLKAQALTTRLLTLALESQTAAAQACAAAQELLQAQILLHHQGRVGAGPSP